jgi:phage shock protein A
MNPFRALATMLNGIMSLFIKDWAASNPEAAYEGILQDKLKERARLLSAAGQVVGERNARQTELNTVKRQLAEVERKITGAVRNNDTTVGALLLQQKEALTRQIGDLEPQVAQLNTAAENITQDIGRFNAQIKALKQEATVNTARIRSARAQKRIMDMVEGLSVDTDDQMLQGLRQRVEAEVGEVQVRQEIDTVGNIDRQLQRAEASAEHSGYEAEFEALRQQHLAQQDTHVAQTTPPSDGGKQA